MKKLNSITFCIAPPANAGGSFVCRGIKAKNWRLFRLRKPTEYDKINSEKYRKEIETMRKKTDLEAVKETLKLFLYIPISETPMFPLFVQHPIFETGNTYIDGEMVDITQSEGFNRAAKEVEKTIDKIDDAVMCLNVLRQSYYLTFLKYVKNDLSIDDFSLLLGRSWTKEENPNGDVNVSVSLAAKWFRETNKKVLMDREEYAVYDTLPESFTVYRGVTRGRNQKGMSWTRDLKKAEWFSGRFGDGYVLEGTAEKKDVLAFFGRRNEEEIVIEAKNVQNKQKI